MKRYNLYSHHKFQTFDRMDYKNDERKVTLYSH